MSRKAYNADEVSSLLQIVESYKSILENKKSDTITSKCKDDTWEKVAEQFNAVTASQRSAKDLKKKYANLKYGAKSKAATIRQSMYATGGGTSTSVALNSVEEKMLDLLNEKEVHGIDTPYDNDATKHANSEEAEAVEDFGPHKLRKKKNALLETCASKPKKGSAWVDLAATKKFWTEEYIKIQIKHAEAEEKRKEEYFLLQKEMLLKEEQRKKELHDLQMKLLLMLLNLSLMQLKTNQAASLVNLNLSRKSISSYILKKSGLSFTVFGRRIIIMFQIFSYSLSLWSLAYIFNHFIYMYL